MSRCRIAVENGFGKVSSLWRMGQFGANLQPGNSPVAAYYSVAVLLTNIYSCLRGRRTCFGLVPPTLDDYLRLRVSLRSEKVLLPLLTARSDRIHQPLARRDVSPRRLATTFLRPLPRLAAFLSSAVSPSLLCRVEFKLVTSPGPPFDVSPSTSPPSLGEDLPGPAEGRRESRQSFDRSSRRLGRPA